MNIERAIKIAQMFKDLAFEHETELADNAIPFMTDVLLGLNLFYNACTNDEQQVVDFTHTLNTIAVMHVVKQKEERFKSHLLGEE